MCFYRPCLRQPHILVSFPVVSQKILTKQTNSDMFRHHYRRRDYASGRGIPVQLAQSLLSAQKQRDENHMGDDGGGGLCFDDDVGHHLSCEGSNTDVNDDDNGSDTDSQLADNVFIVDEHDDFEMGEIIEKYEKSYFKNLNDLKIAKPTILNVCFIVFSLFFDVQTFTYCVHLFIGDRVHEEQQGFKRNN